MQNSAKTGKWRQIIGTLVAIALTLSILSIIGKIFLAPAETIVWAKSGPAGNDDLITLAKCCMALLVMIVPSLAERKLSVDIPDQIGALYFMFLFAAIFLGDVWDFYAVIPFWDTILHAFSGALLTALGFVAILHLSGYKRQPLGLSPLAVACLAFCFAMTMGCFWEMYEYTVDGLLFHNLQGYALGDGTLLCGRAALADTMEDIFTNAISAMLSALAGYLMLKKQSA